MVKVQHLTPSVYYRESRDFQLFGRIYDILFNYVKNNVNCIGEARKNIPSLLSPTLGYKLNRDISNDLYIFLSSMPLIQKYKGSQNGIYMLIASFLNACGIYKGHDITIEVEDNIKVLNISIPYALDSDNIIILEALLDYILPVSTLYNIKVATAIYNATQEGKIYYTDGVDVSAIVGDNSRTSSAETSYLETKTCATKNIIGEVTPVEVGDIRFSDVKK